MYPTLWYMCPVLDGLIDPVAGQSKLSCNAILCAELIILLFKFIMGDKTLGAPMIPMFFR